MDPARDVDMPLGGAATLNIALQGAAVLLMSPLGV